MNPKSPSSEPSSRLDRAQKALVALKYREQAALYHAAAASLELAIQNAAQGQLAELDQWLEKNGNLIEGNTDVFAVPSPNAINTSSSNIVPIQPAIPQSSFVSKPTFEPTGLDEPTALDASTSVVEPSTEVAALASTPKQAMASKPNVAQKTIAATTPTASIENSNSPKPSDAPNPTNHSFWNEMATAAEARATSLPTVQMESSADKSKSPKSIFAQLDFLGSVIVHGAIVLILAFIVIKQADPPEKVAIVSAPLESDVALTETPLESESETLEEAVSPSQTVAPDMSSVSTEVSLPSVDVAVNVEGLVGGESGSSLADQMKSAMSGMAQSKSMQGAAFFGLQATGNTFIYLVDNSPSMRRDNAFDNARNEMIRSLMSMKPKQRFFMIMFGKEMQRLSFPGEDELTAPVYATPENVQKAIAWLQTTSVQKEGWPPSDALEVAIEMDPDAIFMLFDGATRADVPKFLERVNRSSDIISDNVPKVPVHVIHFFEEEYAKEMQKIAKENLGTYRFIPRPSKDSTKNKL